MEQDPYLAEAFLGKLSRVIQADAAARTIADLARARSYQLAVVGIGSSVEASVLRAGNLVDAGHPVDLGQGASAPSTRGSSSASASQHVISPEADSGGGWRTWSTARCMDYIEFDDGYAIVKMAPPREASASRSARARSAASTA